MRFPFRTALGAVLFAVASTAVLAQGSAPDGFRLHKLNASVQPVTENGITTFHILPEDCSDLDYGVDYGNGHRENDCLNGNTKSQIASNQDATLGETFTYQFDVWVDPNFGYEGEYIQSSLPFRDGGWDSRLRIASWEGPHIKNFIYMLKLDAKRGLTFFGQQCASPASFGEWVSFEMKIHWANDQRGWIAVTCDDKIVYSDEAVSTTAQIQCYEANECRPGLVHDPKSFNFLLGLGLNGKGYTWEEVGYPSKWSKIPPEGLMIKMRNISMREGAELYGPGEQAQVKVLQELLNALGCPVGIPDGVVGPKTRQQALTCRSFPPGEMPLKLTVATLDTFVSLYSRPGVADLGPGEAPIVPDQIFVFQTKDNTRSGDEVVHYFQTVVRFGGAAPTPLDFILIGPYDQEARNFRELSVLIDQDIGDAEASVTSCGENRVEDWGEGGSRLVLQFGRSGDTFEITSLECIVGALPATAAGKVAYLVDHFGDFARAMVEQGTVAGITNADVRTFIERIAAGEVAVVRGEPVDVTGLGLVDPEYELGASTPGLDVADDGTLALPLVISTFGLGLKFNEVSIQTIGQLDEASGVFDWFDVLLDAPLPEGAVDALKKCSGIRTEEWDDGSRIVFQTSVEANGTRYFASGLQCAAPLIGDDLGGRARFAFSNFSDIAVAMMKAGIAQRLDKGLASFFESVAKGEITVLGESSGQSVAGLVDASFVVHAREKRSRTEAGDSAIGSNIVGTVEGADFGDLDLHFSGHVAVTGDAIRLTIDVGDTLGEGASDISGKCPRATVFSDESGDHLRFNVRAAGTTYKVTSGECVAANLPGPIGKKAAFVLDNFSDIAVGMAKDGTLDTIVNDGFRTFMTRVATGDLTFGH